MSAPTVIQWVLDTRNLWPDAKQTIDLARVAHRAMVLLSDEEQAAALRFYFVKDAKLSLGSSLLKRLAISRFCSVPWRAATATRDERTKPVFVHAATGAQPLLFNISHQAGVVVLLGVHLPPPGLAIGVDVVCPGERRARDRDVIAKEGWSQYVAVHEDVFCPREGARLRGLWRGSGGGGAVDELLAYFYALWCLREAYVKMTGEALLAPWLKELEMRYFAPPGETPPEGEDKGLEVWLRGRRVEDADVRLERALEDEYMIATVVRRGTGGEGVEVGEFEVLRVDEVLASCEELMKRGEQ